MSSFSLHINCGWGWRECGQEVEAVRGNSAPAAGPTEAPETRALAILSASLFTVPCPLPRPQKERKLFQRSEGERAQGEGREAPEQSPLLRRSSAMAGLEGKRPRSGCWSALPPALASGRAHPQGPPSRGGTKPGSADSFAPPSWWAAASRLPPGRDPAPDPAPRCPAAGLTSRSPRRCSGPALRPRSRACSAPNWNIFLWPPRLQGEAPLTVQLLASGVKANPRCVYLPGKSELDSGTPRTFPVALHI